MSQRFWDWHAIISYDLKTTSTAYQERVNDILKNLPLNRQVYILDAGCGTGYLIKAIKEKEPSVQIEAIDYSRSMLDRARKRCKDLKNVRFKQVDLDKRLPYPANIFDSIVCDNVLYAIPRPKFTLKEFFRIVKPGGRVVVVIPKPKIEGKAIISHQLRDCKTFCQKMIAFLKMMITYILIMPFEISIDKKIKKGIYNSLTGNEVLTIMNKIGFKNGKIGLTFANQNWIISAQK